MGKIGIYPRVSVTKDTEVKSPETELTSITMAAVYNDQLVFQALKARTAKTGWMACVSICFGSLSEIAVGGACYLRMLRVRYLNLVFRMCAMSVLRGRRCVSWLMACGVPFEMRIVVVGILGDLIYYVY